ncbi:MAG: nicotinate (nicotinamide) nucleotide adenylyltransferase [Acidobacteria bacterium]|nr:nicotinate (nicotinamide) nucleotide adenylyltransferase [Acidobacteriota bacterium]MBV9069753.1 nicotinate (nicotinamide) nucleotide adenylyltransferase [Acidobacteriota bacterium]MBV9184105.1 nicotinate (nicotinamide) nucleotide adenylyltransferase [Acidobacteriota bacterium]
MRIGIVGGTFDPFHRGHLDPVLAAREKLQWDRVLYIPAWRQPFKTDHDAAPGPHRFAMTALAIRDHEALYVSPIELERGGISYSVDTLEELHRQFAGADFDWIIGDDNLKDLDRWKDPERLYKLARFVVLTRLSAGSRESGVGEANADALSPTLDTRHPTPARATIVFADNNTVPISSTEIRRRVRAGEPIDGLVDPLVSRYIHHYGLYKEGQH